MLNAKAFNELVARAVGDGVDYAFVLDGRGVVIATACCTGTPRTPLRRSGNATVATAMTSCALDTEGKVPMRDDSALSLHPAASSAASAGVRSCPSESVSNGENGTSAVNDEDTVYAAVVSAVHNLWRAYGRCDLAVNTLTLNTEPEALEQVLLDFGAMRLCAMSVKSGVVLCLVSLVAAHEIGLLKLKTAALQRAVFDMLAPILAD